MKISPSIELYMDQVVGFINEAFQPIWKDAADKGLTSTMINNYVKHKVIPASVKKKYNKEHMAYLLMICVLKQVLTISEIRVLADVQRAAWPLPKAYDFFCTELEKALQAVFTGNDYAYEAKDDTDFDEKQLVRFAVVSFATKLYLQKWLEMSDFNPPKAEKTSGKAEKTNGKAGKTNGKAGKNTGKAEKTNGKQAPVNENGN